MQIGCLRVFIEFFDIISQDFHLVIFFLKFLGYLFKQCFLSLNVVNHGFKDSINTINSKFLLNKHCILLTQLIVHAGLNFLHFIHYPISHRITASLNNWYPIHVHLQLHLYHHLLILSFDHPKPILNILRSNFKLLIKLLDNLLDCVLLDNAFVDLEPECPRFIIQVNHAFQLVLYFLALLLKSLLDWLRFSQDLHDLFIFVVWFRWDVGDDVSEARFHLLTDV